MNQPGLNPAPLSQPPPLNSNLTSSQLNLNPNLNLNPAAVQSIKSHPLLPLPNSAAIRPPLNAGPLVNFPPTNRLPNAAPQLNPLLSNHLNPRLPLVGLASQPPPNAALLNRLPNQQLLQNPQTAPGAGLIARPLLPVPNQPPHLLPNASVKPPHLLHSPLIAGGSIPPGNVNPLIPSGPLVVPISTSINPTINSPINASISTSIVQQANGIQNSPIISTSNDQLNSTSVDQSLQEDGLQDSSPSNGQAQQSDAVEENSAATEPEQQTNATATSETPDVAQPEGDIWIETTTNEGKIYYYNGRTRETSWSKPENCEKVITHEQFMQQQQQFPPQMMKLNGDLTQNHHPHPHLPFQPIPGGKHHQNSSSLNFLSNSTNSFSLFTPKVMPPFAQFPMPGLTVPMMMPPMMAAINANSQKMMLLVPAEIRIAALEWMEYKTPEGKPYYFSTKTQQSVWEKPKPLLDLETALNKVKSEQKLVQNKEEKKADKNKPVSSTAISNTPWCLVKTGDDRVFFYNPSTKTSVWQRPKELEGNEEVDQLLSDGTVQPAAAKKDSKIVENKQSTTAAPKQDEPPLIQETIDKDKNAVVSGEESNSSVSSSANKEAKAKESVPPVKRSSSSIESDAEKSNDATLVKKQKVNEEEESRKQMGITSIEAIASKQREKIPLEERIEMFTKMLEEKEVSAFSTWEKQLHKIVFDSRYLLLTSKERKQTFDKYIRERAEKERKEKMSKTKKQKQEFRSFLKDTFKENGYSARLTYAEFAKKHSNSEQFKLIEKAREREQLFNEFLDELKKKERDEKQKEKDKAKDNFLDLLKENQKLFDRHSRFGEVRDRFRDDPRYKALQTVQKEDLFRSFVSNLPSSRRSNSKCSYSKERTHHRESSRSDKYKESNKSSKSAEKAKIENSDEESNATSSRRPPEELDEGELNPSSAESDNDSKPEKEAKLISREKLSEEERRKREKQERIERSLKERASAVQKEMEGHLLNREIHRDLFKKKELVENFNILLIDLIRNPDMTYRDAKKILKKDHRYEMFESLGRTEKEDLFDEHINSLIRKKRKMFIELLEETKEVKLNSSWREVRRLIKEDPRYLQLSERRCEKEFEHFLREKLVKAKNDFKCLLRETKIITYKSRKLIDDTDQQHLADIISHLQNDKRYLDLDLIEDERRQLIIDYIEGEFCLNHHLTTVAINL